jgi:hypothetical protein
MQRRQKICVLSADCSLVCLDADERMSVGGLLLCGVLWCGAHPSHSLALPGCLLVSESFVACLLKNDYIVLYQIRDFCLVLLLSL